MSGKGLEVEFFDRGAIRYILGVKKKRTGKVLVLSVHSQLFLNLSDWIVPKSVPT